MVSPSGTTYFEVRPTLDVHVLRGGRKSTVRALVDTGSPITLFGQIVALRLDVDLEDRDESRIQKVDLLGRPREVLMAEIELSLDHFPGITWTTTAGFLREDLDLPFAGVLGNTGFMDQWVVSFNRGSNYFIVEEPASFAERQPRDPVETVLDYFGDEDWWPTDR